MLQREDEIRIFKVNKLLIYIVKWRRKLRGGSRRGQDGGVEAEGNRELSLLLYFRPWQQRAKFRNNLQDLKMSGNVFSNKH